MATKKRTKSQALTIVVPATREEAADRVRQLGDLNRQHALRKAELDGKVAALAAEYAPILSALADKIGAEHQAIQIWAEAHRAALTQGGKVKTVQLITGEIGWRQRPPSVTVRQADVVIKTLKDLSLSDYVRTEEEVNKAAILDLMAAAAAITDEQMKAGVPGAEQACQRKQHAELIGAIKGITINRGVEDFNVAPFETEAATPV